MHKIELARAAEAVYRRLSERDPRLLDRIDAALDADAAEPRSGKPLKGAFAGQWSYRIGQYRILYRIENRRLVILVLDIGHRREIYR